MSRTILNRRRFLLTFARRCCSYPALDLAAQSHPPDTLPPAIAALTNRRSEAVPITLAEREQRLDRARALMHPEPHRRHRYRHRMVQNTHESQ